MEEIYKDIKGYEGFYQISNLGNVKNVLTNTVKSANILNDYCYVHLYRNKKRKSFLIHRLEWETFIGEIPEGYEINHINEDKTDNRLSNLCLMTHKENLNWGTRNLRANTNRSKPIVQYDLDGNFIKEWFSATEVQRQLGFNQGNISKCCTGGYKTAYNYKWKYK